MSTETDTVVPFPLERLQRRQLLQSTGYSPIPVSGKEPLFKNWPKLLSATPVQIVEWETLYPDHKNTGLLAAVTPGFDIDIRNEAAAKDIEAMVRSQFNDSGKILVRIGQAPKRLIPFQASEPFKKKQVVLHPPGWREGDPGEKIEFLASGQQWVAFGVHPDTLQQYTWRGGEPGQVKLSRLPVIEEAEAEQLVEDAVKLLIDKHDYTRSRAPDKSGKVSSDDRDEPQNYAKVEAALSVIPADDEHDWFVVCSALTRADKTTTGPDWNGLYHSWSAKSAKYNRGEAQAKWLDKAQRDYAYTQAVIFSLATRHDPTWLYRYNYPGRNEPDTPVLEERETDLGNSRRFVRIYRQDSHYVYAWKTWIIWTGDRWIRDSGGVVMELAKTTVEGMWKEANDVPDERARSALRTHAKKSEKRDRLIAMVALSQSAVPLSVSEIDADPMMLGVQNGVINLTTGEFRSAKREDYITKRCHVHYDPAAECPRWRGFLGRIFQADMPDADMLKYVQRVVGYTLTGETGEEVIFFLWGDGANGKSTFRETIFALMGDYAAAGSKDLLIENKKSGGATPELAKLHGKRLVTINETKQGDVLNEDRLKAITSHDMIAARFLFENEFDFAPTHKGFVTTQYKPIVKGIDEGLWRRIHMWPFEYMFPEDERDKKFRENVLLPELPGILNWALQGLKDYQRRKSLAPPDTVTEATKEYRKEMDLVGRWVDEKCVLDVNAEGKTKLLYASYQDWMSTDIGLRPISIIQFGRTMAKILQTKPVLVGPSDDRDKGYRGIKLKGSDYFTGESG